MWAPSPRSVEPPCPDIKIDRVHLPSVEYYRFLYESVGRQYHWVDRLLLSDEELGNLIHDDRVEIYVLQVAGDPAGYAELDRRTEDEIELAYFGLFSEYTGKGLGKYFLAWTVERAWSYAPKRVWVHTCDLDHPAALPSYLKAGFSIFAERMIEQVIFP
jgi:GNAT superfamily N-acetyltransferase